MLARRNVYYLFLNGETAGPYTLEGLHEMWQEEKITPETLYVQPGMTRSSPVNLILNKVIGYQKPVTTEAVPPVEKGETRSLSGAYVTAVIGIVLFCWAVGSARNPSRDPSRALNARIAESRARLSVVNGNDYDWKGQSIVLNGKPPQGYKHRILSLKPGESAAVWLTHFVDETGARFEPWRMEIKEVWIGDDKLGYRFFPPPPSEGRLVPPPFPPPIQ